MRLQHLAIILLISAFSCACSSNGGSKTTIPLESPNSESLPDISQLDKLNAVSIAGYSRLGKDYTSASAGVQIEGNSLNFDVVANELLYAIYSFDSTAEDVLASVAYHISDKGSLFSPVYLMVADYDEGRWEIHTSDNASELFQLGAEAGQYTSPAGKTYVAMLAWDGEYYVLESVEVFFSNQTVDTGVWPTVGGRNMRRNLSSDNVVDTANIHWKFQAEKRFLHSAPVQDGNGIIYLGSYEPDQQKGSLYALDAEGQLLWQHEVLDNISATPAISPQGHVIFGDLSHYLYGLNNLGVRALQVEASREIYTPAAVLEDGSIFYGTPDSELYKLDYLGIEQWHVDTSTGVYGAPSLDDDGKVYIGTSGGNLLCISAGGSIEWTFTGNGEVHSSACITETGNIVYATQAGNIYSVDPTGEEIGSDSPGGSFDASPALGPDGNIYIGNMDGKLYKYGSDASLIDTFDAGSAIEGTAVIDADGTVFFGCEDGMLYALDQDLEIQWQYDSQDSFRCGFSIVGNGMLLTPTVNGSLIAFAENELIVPQQPTGLTASQGTFPDYVVLQWDEQFDATGFEIYRDGGMDPLATVGYVTTWSDEGLVDDTMHEYTIVAVNETGSSVSSPSVSGWASGLTPGAGEWNMFAADSTNSGLCSLDGPHTEKLAWSYETSVTSLSCPVIGANKEIYFSTGYDDSNVYSISAEGNLRWKSARTELISFGLAIDEAGYIYGSEAGSVFRIKPDGTEDWSQTYTNYNFGPPTLHDGYVYYSADIFNGGDETLKLAQADGSESWSYSHGSKFAAPAIGSDGRVYISGGSNRMYVIETDGTDGGHLGASGTVDESALVIHDLINGDYVAFTSGPKLYAWQGGVLQMNYPSDNDNVTGMALMPGATNIATIGDECSRIDLTGMEVWTEVPSKKTEYATPAVDSSGYIYYGDSDGIFRCIAPGGTVAWDYDTETELHYSSPAIGPDNRVYIVGENGTLFAFENAD